MQSQDSISKKTPIEIFERSQVHISADVRFGSTIVQRLQRDVRTYADSGRAKRP